MQHNRLVSLHGLGGVVTGYLLTSMTKGNCRVRPYRMPLWSWQ